jgi:hypothetical protein
MGQQALPAAPTEPSRAPSPADKKKNPELTPPDPVDPVDLGVFPDKSPGPANEPPPPLPDFAEPREPVDAEDGEGRMDAEDGDIAAGFSAAGVSSAARGGSDAMATSGSMARMLPVDMPGCWADLVEDFALDRPFTSSPLRHSRLDMKDGDPVTLEVTFAGVHYHDLFLSDGENRKSLREFLTARLAPGTLFTLAFSGGEPGGEAPAPIRTIHPAASAEALLEEEPGLRKLIEVFEGRLID